MDYLIHQANGFYAAYRQDLFPLLLAVILVLTIIGLGAVRRCRRQVKKLEEKENENTKMMQLYLKKQEAAAINERHTSYGGGTGRSAQKASPEDEAVFGSVIQEIFP